MKTNQIIAIIVVVIVVAAGVGLYAISDKNPDNRPDKVVRPDDSDHYPITVSFPLGGKTYEQTFTEAPERVVVLNNPNLELLIYFGLQDRIVGAYASETVTVHPNLQEEFDKIDKLPRNSPSVEITRSLEPDLILGWASTFTDALLGSVEMWNGYDTKCFITNRPSDAVTDYITLLENIGKIFNRGDVAAEKIAAFTSSYDAIKTKTSSLKDSEKVTALVIEPGYEGSCFVYGSGFLSGDLVTVAGGINLFEGKMERLTFEQIASYDPDIIFLEITASGSGTDPQEAIKVFQSIPGFASMTDNLVAFSFYEIYMGGILSETVIDRMFEAMYPEN